MTTIQTALPDIQILANEPLSKYTFTETGGPADFLAFPRSAAEVEELFYYAQAHDLPWTTLGNASNLIVRDGGIRGLVVILTEMKAIDCADGLLSAQAGAKLVDVSDRALAEGLSGLEFACGIPGSVGGAVFMNAGAYDGEIAQVFESCQVLSKTGKIETLTKEEMKFGYRRSVLQEDGAVMLQATFRLTPEKKAVIQQRMDELTALRKSKQPLEYPSCGSVFKRPAGHYTGALIQKAGLQGLKWGGAQVSEKHAGFIVNIDHATATDYLELIQHIQQVIKEKFDVDLEVEVRIIGEEPV
ncbi:MAG: UDP-N-acetylmuramate dehydrogenase [Enterococcaceae bacterium]|jgi:UDP-N-acetylmuramate dehydrogenase|nr:UDP-N-acetylmuramate dehydrogenase [Enterococcaceae bacterium]MCI1918534.1 UDP-N-acetylmuramate dehydrogenase [Enterococcaceae bacterium]